ncbi:MAG: 50S ribosomal protein L24 [Armatimonadetes bacterium]|nr:50S ribosomal protein L24 [Armatimonadota bacterium]
MPTVKLPVKKGDQVQIITGKDRSKRGRVRRGRVLQVRPDEGRLVVEGVNMQKKAQRQSQKIRQGGVIEKPGPIHVSNVMLVCPNCDSPTRAQRVQRDEGRRVRVCRKCKKDIDTD